MLVNNLIRVALALASYTQIATSIAVVDLGYAKYAGDSLAAGVDQFLGMRYARPPIGDLRFRAPQKPQTEFGIKSATQFGKACIGPGHVPSSSLGEDCLFVNVFKPSNANKRSKLPVWVYIQGGGYKTNPNTNYNGTKVVVESSRSIVFVNFNYRVGPLGFLASQKVKKGDLNAGLLDQRRLLWWVKEHIAKFGGDPGHVVLHGVSAGGGSISHHLTAYGARDDKLFVAAGLQSPFWPTLRTVAESEFQFDRLVQNTNCADQKDALACLRSAPLAGLINAAVTSPYPGASILPLPTFYWLPVIDGDFVRDHLSNLFGSGKFVKVPMLITHTTNEGSEFAYNAKTMWEVQNFLKNSYPKMTAGELVKVAEAYPLTAPAPYHNAYFPSASGAYGDRTFTCAGNEVAASVAKFLSSGRVWNYRFNVQDPVNVVIGLGVPHAFDTAAILGVGYGGIVAESYKTVNAAIIPITMKYWISFIRSLDPNIYRAVGAPVWEPWGTGNGKRLKLQTNDVKLEAVPPLLTKRCELWKTLSGSR
ncbi:hypothetical protein G7Z17_g454 [Cylindrodendrum hubeiense]|uniref:Carboxylic ester hydrolase n=1 Tax=Cylindrodendrum hubeiense TaxID=595255 RepID=A0A9P5HLE6_9HYPO|nr:hypothetical protein G7Z17_g454 [Cylindrodendrum hubeiense]